MLLTVAVAIPLTIKVIIEGGGPWGFEIVSLAILVPLSCYLFFGISGMLKSDDWQKRFFIIGHALTIITGIGGYFVFPLYPFWVASVPVALAIAGISSHKIFVWYLLGMIALTIFFNIVLLKWELDFGRTIPLFQLF